jgi:hypothetical protein
MNTYKVPVWISVTSDDENSAKNVVFDIISNGSYKTTFNFNVGTPLTNTDFIIINLSNTWKGWKEIDGWFTENDARSYQLIVGQYTGGNFAEVGCWKGRSFASILPVLQTYSYKNIYAIDTWKGTTDSQYDEVKTVDVFDQFTNNMRRLKFTSTYTPILQDSVSAANTFDDEFFDVVFIDANHAYDAVNDDIKYWLPKVKKGGTLCGHDINHHEVKDAVINNFGNGTWTHIPDNIWVYQKPY